MNGRNQEYLDQEPSAQEPSMEDILASIRKILAEGEEEVAKSDTGSDTGLEDDILELTDQMMVEEDDEEPLLLQPEPDAQPDVGLDGGLRPSFGEAPPDRLISQPTEAASSAIFSELYGALAGNRELGAGTSGITLEDIVREALKPLLREWLDANLPDVVERLVRREIEMLVSGADKR